MKFININQKIKRNKCNISQILLLLLLAGSIPDVHAEFIFDSKNCIPTRTTIECKVEVCTVNTYIFYQREGYRCTDPKTYTLLEEDGYYLDSSSFNNGRITHLIKRTTDHDEVLYESIPGMDGYYVNAGDDRSSFPLIFCQAKKGCITGYASNHGYYIPADGLGIIHCSENAQCKWEKEVSNYYLNAGYQRKNLPLIRCYKGKCQGRDITDGYYLMHQPSTLLQCLQHQCQEIQAHQGYYLNAENKRYNIMCIKFHTNVSCGRRPASPGVYISADPKVLLDCRKEGECHEEEVFNGIYRASTTYELVPNGSQRDDADTKTMYNLISCQNQQCKELSITELNAIPVCSYTNGICFITPPPVSPSPSMTSGKGNENSSSDSKNYLAPGEYCTNENHSKLYLATGIISLKNEDSSMFYLPSEKNCLNASDQYHNNYFFFTNKLYRVNEGKIAEITKIGFYMLNTASNTLVMSQRIEDYNKEEVDIYYCNGNYCKYWERPEVTTYLTDTLNRIFRYSPKYRELSFAYRHDLRCIYTRNSCIVEIDGKSEETERREFCITDTGELVLLIPPSLNEDNNTSITTTTTTTISTSLKSSSTSTSSKNNKQNQQHHHHPHHHHPHHQHKDSSPSTSTSPRTFLTNTNTNAHSMVHGNFTMACIKANQEGVAVYGLTKEHFYQLHLKSASLVTSSGYYLVNPYNHQGMETKDFTKPGLTPTIYSCLEGQCEVTRKPSSHYYYYDNRSQLLVKYRPSNSTWEVLNSSGFVHVSLNPRYESIFRYSPLLDRIALTPITEEGDYYTLDEKLYTCVKVSENDYSCELITTPNDYFTVNGFILHCEDKEIEEEEEGEEDQRKEENSTLFQCEIMKCNSDEIYSIYEDYYRCHSNHLLLKINNKQCSFNEKVVINYPTMFNNAMDEDVYRQVLNAEALQEKYHRKTSRSRRRKPEDNIIPSIHGVFTNCTYDKEVKVFNYDLICAEDQVMVNLHTKIIEICSKMDYGFVQCVAEENNPDRCNPNASPPMINIPYFKQILFILFLSLLFIY